MTQTLASTADNYLNWVNTEAISYVSVDEADENVTTAVTHARSFRLTKLDVELIGGTRAGRAWRIPVAVLGGVVPRRGDKFTDASSTVWYVEDVEWLHHKEQWRLLCVQKPD